MNIITYQQLYKAIDKLTYDIAYSNIQIDAVVPALRSGMIPAFRIAEKLHLPIMVENTLYGGYRLSKGRKVKNILIVDDSINSGRSMYDEIIKYKDDYNVYTSAVIASFSSKSKVNFYTLVVDQPRMFEWNMFNSTNTNKVMFDMDGVICINPRVFDNDGESYQNEIKNLPRLFVPSYAVHSIVTNRIERWRPETEAWLKSNGVTFGSLIMQQYSTAVERRATSDAGEMLFCSLRVI